MAIERIFPGSPFDIVYNDLSFVQRWCRLVKPTDQVNMKEGVEQLMSSPTSDELR